MKIELENALLERVPADLAASMKEGSARRLPFRKREKSGQRAELGPMEILQARGKRILSGRDRHENKTTQGRTESIPAL